MKNRLPRLMNTSADPRARLALALASTLLIGGCAPQYYVNRLPCEPAAPKPSYVVLIPSPDGTVGKVLVRNAQGEQLLTQAGQAETLDGKPLLVDHQQLAQDFGAARAAQPKIPARFVLYFKSGNTLTAESDAEIPKIIAEAKTRPAVDITVIGNTDTLRSAAYNEELGLKRANRIAELLRQRGLSANSLSVESRGETNLLVKTPDETYEPKNRRCEISVR
jgi:adhesin transport system outer membrane protein